MINASFLWIDLQHHSAVSHLFEGLPKHYKGCKVKNPSDIHPHILKNKPLFLCFEFDSPQSQDLAILQKTKLMFPELPVLMITNPHTEALAIWAFRSGVRDYLIKPCSQEYLNASIRSLIQITQLAQQSGYPRKPLYVPTVLTDDILNKVCHSFKSYKTAPALHFLEKHYTEDVRLAKVAELCGLSESVFSRTFKKEHHINFSEYVMKMRIKKACELLKKPSTQIKAVAFSVGFNDLSYFTRIFRRYINATPSHYQRAPDTFDIR